jgi:serine/threonine protein kinase
VSASAEAQPEYSEFLAELDGMNIKVKSDTGEAFYELSRLFDPGQLAPTTAAYRAERKPHQEKERMPEYLVLKVPCLEGVSSEEERAARVRGVKERLDFETEIMSSRLASVETVPKLYAGRPFYFDARTQIEPYLLRHYVDGISLAMWMDEYAKNHEQDFFTGIENVEHWFNMAVGLVEALEQIHHQRIVHGDLRAENIIVTSKKGAIPNGDQIKLINAEEEDLVAAALSKVKKEGVFRRKYDCPSKLFEKASPDAAAKIRNADADWYAPADVFSLGAVLLELACGRRQSLEPFLHEIPVPEMDPEETRRNGGSRADFSVWRQVLGYEERKSDRQLKEFVLRALDEHNKKLHPSRKRTLDAKLLITEVIMACTRTQPETQTSDLRSVRQVLDQFPPSRPAGSSHPSGNLTKLIAEETKTLCEPVRAVMRRRAQLLEHDLKTLNKDHMLRISGSRAHLVDVLITVLRSLGKGDICRALTTPTFFFDRNMGPFGRITSALLLASQSGVEVDWILVVDEHSLRDRHVAEVLEAQRQGAEWLKNKPFKMQFSVASAKEFKRILQHKLTFIEAGPKGNPENQVLIAPDYRGDSGNISVLRLWSSPPGKRRNELDETFDRLARQARPVTRYKR